MKVCPSCDPTTRTGYTVFFSSTTHTASVPVPAIAAGGTAMIVAGSAKNPPGGSRGGGPALLPFSFSGQVGYAGGCCGLERQHGVAGRDSVTESNRAAGHHNLRGWDPQDLVSLDYLVTRLFGTGLTGGRSVCAHGRRCDSVCFRNTVSQACEFGVERCGVRAGVSHGEVAPRRNRCCQRQQTRPVKCQHGCPGGHCSAGGARQRAGSPAARSSQLLSFLSCDSHGDGSPIVIGPLTYRNQREGLCLL